MRLSPRLRTPGALRSAGVTAALGLGLAALGATSASATVLTFDIDNSKPNNNIAMIQSYGDRVATTVQGAATYGVGAEGFTPNVLVSYDDGPQGSLIRWTTNYGDLVNVLENEVDSSSYMDIVFTADPGFKVALFGFDLAGWPQADYTLPGVQVTSGAATLFSQSNVLVQGNAVGPRHTSFSFGSGLTGDTLSLRLNLAGLGSNSDNIGIDNIRFGQVAAPVAPVPEPAGWALMVLGIGGTGGLLRLQRRRVMAAAI